MESTNWAAPARPPAGQPEPDILALLLLALAAGWIAVVTIVLQVGAWLYDQAQLLDGVNVPGWFWIVIALVQALLAGAPALALAAFARPPHLRAAARAWCWATMFGLLLSLARLLPPTWTQPAAVVQIVLSLLAIFII
jgi:hypothetical protein